MTEPITQQSTDIQKPAATEPQASLAVTENRSSDIHDARDGRGGGNRSSAGKRNFRSKTPRRTERVKPDFEQKIVAARRVTRVVAGGRRFSFSIALVIGDKQGRVGIGLGKANDTALAIQKALHQAKKNLVQVRLTDDKTIPFESEAKNKSARVNLRPNGGRGLVAGSASRVVLDMAGIRNVTAHVISRTRNKINNARATIDALDPFVIARGTAALPVIARASVPADTEMIS
jgi:small subunit ribosomal protein S5